MSHLTDFRTVCAGVSIGDRETGWLRPPVGPSLHLPWGDIGPLVSAIDRLSPLL